MWDDRVRRGDAYLAHLSHADLVLVAGADPRLAGHPDPAAAVSARPELVEELLSRPELLDAVLGPGDDHALTAVSPFLVFAAAVNRTAADLASASYVVEWLGPRQRAPVFDAPRLQEFLAGGWVRLFLSELLASYTKVASGSVVVATRRGLRRQRFSELDPVHMAGLLDVVPEAERPGVYRRLGDLALFMVGVFPDHTARHGVSSVEESRLLRSGRLRGPVERAGVAGYGDASAVDLFEALGRRWYRLAHDLVPAPVPADVVVLSELAERFGDARRILNVVTDRYLFPFRAQWFGLRP